MMGFDPRFDHLSLLALVYFVFGTVVIAAVFAFLQFTTFGMVVRAGMADRETVGLWASTSTERFTIMFGIAAALSRVLRA